MDIKWISVQLSKSSLTYFASNTTKSAKYPNFYISHLYNNFYQTYQFGRFKFCAIALKYSAFIFNLDIFNLPNTMDLLHFNIIW
jgi:hypothetical protein